MRASASEEPFRRAPRPQLSLDTDSLERGGQAVHVAGVRGCVTGVEAGIAGCEHSELDQHTSPCRVGPSVLGDRLDKPMPALEPGVFGDEALDRPGTLLDSPLEEG